MKLLAVDGGDRRINADTALEKLGAWGRYQMWTFVLSNAVWTFAALQMMSIVFAGATPPFRCALPLNTSANYSDECVVSEWQCDEHEFNNSLHGHTTVSEWSLVCESEFLGSMGASVYFLGFLIGSIVVPPMADAWGRRWLIIVCGCMTGVFGLLSAFAPNYILFLILRMLTGSSTAGMGITSWVLACEVMVPSKRALGVVVQGIFWSFGYCLTGVIAIWIHDWRSFIAVLSVPAFLIIFYYWLIPESLHWYVAMGRVAEATAWVQRAARSNRVLVTVDDCCDADVKEAALPKSRNAFSICTSPALLIHSAIMVYLWFCNTIIYYGLSLFTAELVGDRYLNFILSGLVELPAYIFLMPILNCLGRRFTLCMFHSIASVAILLLAFLPIILGSELGVVGTVLWLVGKYSIASSFMGVWLYGAEVFPTTVRTVGVGVCNIAARSGGILAPFTRALDHISPLVAPVFFGASSVGCALLVLILPETARRQLADDIDQVDPGPLLARCGMRRQHTKNDH